MSFRTCSVLTTKTVWLTSGTHMSFLAKSKIAAMAVPLSATEKRKTEMKWDFTNMRSVVKDHRSQSNLCGD